MALNILKLVGNLCRGSASSAQKHIICNCNHVKKKKKITTLVIEGCSTVTIIIKANGKLGCM